ncbi:uncharacterized protein E5676_scaffold874G00210 [Cucumis melo var. makuwa]|uniref:Uncharacterized protein n=1 Tax=Cucumis melo var. makuwa TaxID=1194695 RepID=A0A5D3CG81_CUCMM|nr:uncharacterized protein E6C27_scaffold98G001370 [Cucumis melo var. makuwa]TYK10987.1 uncharacterized protein E5676_scaffold874G00210 [Cucumis melo var. makuwa]
MASGMDLGFFDVISNSSGMCLAIPNESLMATEMKKKREHRSENEEKEKRKGFNLRSRRHALVAVCRPSFLFQCHRDKRVETDDVFRHPTDAALASYEFNPFGQMSTLYNMWLAMLISYNLPPWKCIKESNFFMSLLMPIPKSPGREIDVYLKPLIEELKELSNFRVRTYDSLTSQFFKLNAALFWTINDFLAYGDLSWWSTKGVSATSLMCERQIVVRVTRVILGGQQFSINYLTIFDSKETCAVSTLRVGEFATLGGLMLDENTSRSSRTIYRSNHGRTRLVDKSSLTIIAVESNARTPVSAYPEGSQPLSGDEICETVLGVQITTNVLIEQ